MKKFISMLLILAMTFVTCTNVMAVEMNVEDENLLLEGYVCTSYYKDDIFVEEVSFIENGEEAFVVKRTYGDGSFDVEAINGNKSIIFEGYTQSAVYMPQNMPQTSSVTYPYYTPYWYAGYDDYSQNGVALTVVIIAALLVANTGIGAGAATTVASAIYTALGSNIYSDVYFRTYRYYTTLEYGPGQPTIWYNKFVTFTYSDSARTNKLTGPTTEIYETTKPML